MSEIFKLSQSPNQTMAIAQECSAIEHFYLSYALRANTAGDPFYERRQKARPFFQSGSEAKSGFVLIEFWTYSTNDVREYIQFLNENYEKTVEMFRQLKMLPLGQVDPE